MLSRGTIEEVILILLAIGAHRIGDLGAVEDFRVIEAFRFPMLDCTAFFQSITATDHFVDGAESELGHDFAHLFGDVGHEIHNAVGGSVELFAESFVLGRDADRAGVFVTNPHHQTTQRYQWCGGKSEFFRSEQTGDRDVATGLELAVGFEDDPASQIV